MKPLSSVPAHQEVGGCLNAQVAWEARDPRDAEERGSLGATVGIFLREAGRPSCLLWVPFLLSTLSPAETFLWEPPPPVLRGDFLVGLGRQLQK